MAILMLEESDDQNLGLRKSIKRVFSISNGLDIFELKNFDSSKLCLEKYRYAIINFQESAGTKMRFIEAIKTTSPFIKTVMLVKEIDEKDIFTALELGVDGIICKSESGRNIPELLDRLKNGEPPLSPSVSNKLVNHFREKSQNILSKREIETLKSLSQGLTVKEVASNMNISPLTVSGYLKTIYQKLNVNNKTAATLKAIKRGYIKHPPI